MKKFLAVMLIAVCTFTAVGCSTAWISQAEAVVAALLPAASNIIALVAALQGKAISAGDLQAIQVVGSQAGTDLQLIQTLLTQYDAADAAAKPGILVKIQTAITAVQGNLNALLPALHIKDQATQTKIAAIVGIVLAEVQSLAAIVPLVNPTATPSMVAMATKQAAKAPPLTAKEFVKAYNATMTAKTGSAELDNATRHLEIPHPGFFHNLLHGIGTAVGQAKFGD